MTVTLKEQILRALKKGPMDAGQIADELKLSRKRIAACIREIRNRDEGVIHIARWAEDKRARTAVYALGGMSDAPMEEAEEEKEPARMEALGNLGKATRHLENVRLLWSGRKIDIAKAEESVRRVPEVFKIAKNFHYEILKLSPQGMTRKQIADKIGCSLKNERFVSALNKLRDDGIIICEGQYRLYSMKKGAR